MRWLTHGSSRSSVIDWYSAPPTFRSEADTGTAAKHRAREPLPIDLHSYSPASARRGRTVGVLLTAVRGALAAVAALTVQRCGGSKFINRSANTVKLLPMNPG